ncbi:BLUF domain-containing protein [Flavobacterium sp. ASW18X]|uniref:BLUF domain-containing protein n=1 Tax=Flavobacterium sp. ASW18X TaxID=2572595 RepID=UPI0010AE03DC|nr:BLUF domain-containing protein [Flavobacterium sp. ASW18X]TKD66251.1 BLUF domain-containing protein [Flavobacterium sp. ASW18X]
MYSLIYRSVAQPSFSLPEVYLMLSKARAFNNNHNITGCLLYHNQTFIQLLEGEESALLALYDSIKLDKRHYNVTTLIEQHIETPLFLNWDMAFHEFDEFEDSKHEKLRQIDAIFSKSSAFNKPSEFATTFFKNVHRILFQEN